MTFSLAEANEERERLTKLIDNAIDAMRQKAREVAQAEFDYRKAKAEAWARCPLDDPGVRSGEREWTAARREAWVDAETAELRRKRDDAESALDSAREAQRSRRTQMSALQTFVNAHQAEAEFARTGP